MKLVLIGIPGSGKSTQGNLLSKQLGIPYLSTGHIFRQLANEKSAIGQYVKEILSAGNLIPDKKTLEIVEEYLSRQEYKKGYILDGFPRSINQAKQFKNGIEKVIYIDIPDKDALWRIAYRNNSGGRDDDTVAACKKRIDIFHKLTSSVIKYYEKKGILLLINGAQTIKAVNKQILKCLGKQIVQNKIRSWHQDNKIIIAITGLAGSGKSSAAKFFEEKGIPIIHFGKVINDYVDKNKLEHNEKIHNEIRNKMRKKHGMASMAVLNRNKIEDMIKKHHILVIDGLYSYEEFEYLKKSFTKAKIVILALWAAKKSRYARIEKRHYRNKLKGVDRDLNEIFETNKAPTIALADYLVINDGSIVDLDYKLENIYRELFFG